MAFIRHETGEEDIQFPENESVMTSYVAFLLGNDPIISGLEKYAPTAGGLIVVATSAFRSIQVAADLGAKDTKSVPKIFIIDTSNEVHLLWEKLKELTKISENQAHFFANFATFLTAENKLFRSFDSYSCTCKDCAEKLTQDPSKFFLDLFKKHGYEHVRDIILAEQSIKQSMTDEAPFKLIQQYMQKNAIQNIFVYPSNIAAEIYWMNIKERPSVDKMLANIFNLKANLSIHTNLCRKHWEPKNVYLFTNQEPAFVKSNLALVPRRAQETKSTPVEDETLQQSREAETIKSGQQVSVSDQPPHGSALTKVTQSSSSGSFFHHEAVTDKKEMKPKDNPSHDNASDDNQIKLD